MTVEGKRISPNRTVFAPAVAKTYVVTFRSHNDDRPSKFIVVANDRKAAIKMAWDDRIYVPR